MFERGNQNQQRQLKDIDENIRIDQSLLNSYKGILVNFSAIETEAKNAIDAIKETLLKQWNDFKDAPEKIIILERRITNHIINRNRLTGKITGHTKMVDKLSKMKADIAALEQELKDMQQV